MSAVLARLFFAAGSVAVVLAACGGRPGDPLPEIPEVRSADFPDRARELAAARIEALARTPEDPWANGDLAAILHAHDRPRDAIPLYQRAEVLSDGAFRWLYLLGVAQQGTGEFGRAAVSFRGALSKRNYAPAVIRLGESLAAEGLLEEAAAALGDTADLQDAAAAYALGRVLLDLGDSRRAVLELERAVELAPDSGAARYALGTAYRAEGDEGRAARELGSSGELGNDKPPLDDPVFARVEELGADEHHFLNLGRSLESRGRLTEAVRAYERAIALDPTMASAHANLVGAYGQAGDFERARKHYDLALSANPNIEELHNNWGVLQATTGNPAAAAAAFRRALDVNPNSAGALANLGMALIALGEEQDAIRLFERAVKNDPSNGPARVNLGVAALEAGRLGEAIDHLEAAVAGSAGGSEAFTRYKLGQAYQAAGRASEARDQAEVAMRLAEAAGAEDLTSLIRELLDSLASR